MYYTDHAVTLHHGNALDVLRTLPDDSVHAVVTDPPCYSLQRERDYAIVTMTYQHNEARC